MYSLKGFCLVNVTLCYVRVIKFKLNQKEEH